MKAFRYAITVMAVLLFHLTTLSAQDIIRPEKGYTPHIGVIVSMLEDLKGRITRSVQNLSTEETDFLLDDDANRIGALILHLAATEKHYQVYTFEGRGYNDEEEEFWGTPMDLGANARATLTGKPISYYLDIWDEVRKETLRLLATKDDKWLDRSIRRSSMNNHWAWYHVMEHQANHMGQIRMIIKRIE